MNKKKDASKTKLKTQDGGAVGGDRVVPQLSSRREPGARMSVLLANPDYLLEGFAEKRCQYIGEIDNIPTSADMSNRNYLLGKLDDRRNSGKLPWGLSMENNVTVTLSAYNVKIIKDDRTGNILYRIPIHEIAAVSYVKDDDQHLVFLKAGDARKPQCPCHVLVCPKRADAEEICTILQQAFQLVFTEATMEHLNSSISAGDRTTRSSTFLPGPVPQLQASHVPQTRVSRPQKQKQPQASAPTVPEESSDSEDENADPGDPDPLDSDSTSEGPTAEELVQRYMERLHKLLGFKELREFATLLKSYRDNMLVEEFLMKLKVLYGEQRAFLIPDMRSFIPEEDRATFEKFLHDHDLVDATLSNIPHAPHTLPTSPMTAPPPPLPNPPQGQSPQQSKKSDTSDPQKRRKGRHHHHDSHVNDVDRFLHNIEADMNTVIDSTDF